MNALATLYVNEHLQVLLNEAAEHRMYRVDRPSLLERIASAASNASRALAMPIDNRGTIFPALDDYASRS